MASINVANVETLQARLKVVRDFDANRITYGQALSRLQDLGMLRDDASQYLLGQRR